MQHRTREFAPYEAAVAMRYPVRVTPYYQTLIQTGGDPIHLMAYPNPGELAPGGHEDVSAEDGTRVLPRVLQKYPGRLLVQLSDDCAMRCRHCFRKNRLGGGTMTDAEFDEFMEYLARHSRRRGHRSGPLDDVWEVILSGGDPLVVPDERLIGWLRRIREALGPEGTIRVHSRIPVVLPQRMTLDLLDALADLQPLYVVVQVNHPREMTEQAVAVFAALAESGVPLANQSTLLRGVNDDPRVMEALVTSLYRNRVRPYYLFQCDDEVGVQHFRVPVRVGQDIIRHLRRKAPGLSIPTYIVESPTVLKCVISPSAVVGWGDETVFVEDLDGFVTEYREPTDYPADASKEAPK